MRGPLPSVLVSEGAHRLVVLDEVTYPLNWGWIDEAQMRDMIRNRPAHVSLILTRPGCSRHSDRGS